MNLLKRLYNRYFSGKSPEELDLEYLQSKGMTFGENVQCYSSGSFDHIYPHLITIGDGSVISTNVTILAHDASTNVVGCGTKVGRVSIGKNVFVGTGTIILCDVRIGDNVVIGAGSVVTRDLPGNAVYAGAPARRLCGIEEYQAKNEELKAQREDLSKILPWYEWSEATMEQRQKMKEIVQDGFAFI